MEEEEEEEEEEGERICTNTAAEEGVEGKKGEKGTRRMHAGSEGALLAG
jgi:hypothetical protein